MIRRVLALVHRATAPRPAPAIPAIPAMRGPGELPRLHVLVVPSPDPGGPSDLFLVRGIDGFVLTYPEVQLIAVSSDRLLDSMARTSAHYAPAEVPPPAEPLN